MSVTVRVPAKVNIHLGVGPPGDDGYHALATVFQAIGVYDFVTVQVSDVPGITGTGPWGSLVPTDNSNLAWRAASLVASEYGTEPNLHITIDKSIPVAAGLAGGSADAAGALVATDALFGGTLGRARLEELAATLGSDIPFLLHGGCAIGRGRGTELTPAMTRGSFHWVLAVFNEGLSTPAVYSRIDQMRGHEVSAPEIPSDTMQALAQGDVTRLAQLLHNDLQSAAIALRPQLQGVLDFGLDFGALGAIVSGSGPTCAFVTSDEKKSIDLTVALLGSGLVDSALHAHGPVHGARIVTE